MSSKQDRTYTRTAADLERKYNFGRSFSEILGIANDAQTHAYNAEKAVNEWSQTVTGEFGEIRAQLKMKVEKDANNNLVGKMHIGANQLTIKTDTTELKADGEFITTKGRIGLWDISNKGISKSSNNYLVKINAPETATDDVITVATLSNGAVTDTPFYLKANGAVKMNKGIIGLWDISEKGILKYTDKYLVKIAAPEFDYENVIVVGEWSGGVVTDIPFYLQANGTVGMNKGIIGENVEIYGTLKASKISSLLNEDNNEYLEIFYDDGNFYFRAMEQDYFSSEAGICVSRSNNIGAELYSKHNGNYTARVRCEYGTVGIDGGTTFNDSVTFKESVTFEKRLDIDTIWLHDQLLVSAEAHFNAAKKIFISNGVTNNNSIECAMYASRLDITGNWYASGTWSFSSGETITSDVNRKHDIADMPAEYGTLFDNLRAVVYKYNDGKSNRYHTGFIAQDVDNAITKAGLTRKDFAGLCIENEGKDNELWSLRYGEFVALNTYEIQQLKKELADIKAKIGA